MYMHTYIYIYIEKIYIYIYMCMHIELYIYIYIYVCMYVLPHQRSMLCYSLLCFYGLHSLPTIYVVLIFAALLRLRQSNNDNPKHRPQLNRNLLGKGFR